MYQQITANKYKSALLITLFLIVILALGYLWGQYSGDSFGALTFAGFLAIIMALMSYYSGDKIALALAGAKRINQDENPYVWRMVENLCIAQGMPMPRLYIITDNAMNAFACGRSPKHASIALTMGIIQNLENEELEGVIAHELSHIKNYDIRLGTLVIVLVGTITILSDIFMRSSLFGGRHSRSRENNSGAVIVIIGIILALLAPLIANLIKLAISRRREFLADASGALATRYPEGLARALEKIEQNGQPMTRVSEATAHLYFSSPFGRTTGLMAKLFSTHPPTTERIKALRSMATP